MSDFAAAHAGDDGDWEGLVERCADDLGSVSDCTLGFVYATDIFAAEFDAIVERLRIKTGVRDWIGTVGVGVIGGGREYFDEPAIAVMTARLPADRFRLLEPGAAISAHAAWAAEHGPTVAVVHGDGRDRDLGERLTDVAEELRAYSVGGLGSSRVVQPQVAGRVGTSAISGVLFAQNVVTTTGLSQGCLPIGPARRITSGQDNIVATLDELPALEALLKDVNELPEEERTRAVRRLHVALPIAGGDRADYLVRNLLGADHQARSIAIGDLAEPGRRLIFVRRDAASAANDLHRMASDARKRAPSPPRAALYFSCNARGPNLFGPQSEELAILRERIGDIPILGMFCDGEICNARLYGYTGVLALFA
jgi:small ligand-binding sensory domain FIST